MSNVQYKEIVDEKDGYVSIIKTENGIDYSIPSDPTNSDYRRYLLWLNGEEENGTIS